MFVFVLGVWQIYIHYNNYYCDFFFIIAYSYTFCTSNQTESVNNVGRWTRRVESKHNMVAEQRAVGQLRDRNAHSSFDTSQCAYLQYSYGVDFNKPNTQHTTLCIPARAERCPVDTAGPRRLSGADPLGTD